MTLSSKLRENKREFTIQTSADAAKGVIRSTIFVDGTPVETFNVPHTIDSSEEEVLSLVEQTHKERKQELQDLLAFYQKAMERARPDEMYHLGTAFFHRRLYCEAHDLFASVLKMDSDYHQAQLYLGLTELELGNTDKAISCCKAAVAAKAAYADYHNGLGECYLLANNCTEAINEFTKAIEINLYYGGAYFNLGLALVLNGIISQDRALFANILSKASDHFKKASIIDSSYQGPAFNSGLSALAGSDLQKAWDIFSKLRSDRKEGHRRETAAYFMKSVSFVDQASLTTVSDRIEFLKSELVKNPTFVDRQAELARSYLELARLSWQSGIEQYQRTQEMNQSLEGIPRNLETAGKLYESLVAALERIDRGTGK